MIIQNLIIEPVVKEINMQEPVVFEILEINPDNSKLFLVDSLKLEKFKINNDHEYRYISQTMESIINRYEKYGNDNLYFYSSVKYSMTDQPDWYSELAPDTLEGRIVVEVTVELHY